MLVDVEGVLLQGREALEAPLDLRCLLHRARGLIEELVVLEPDIP